MKIEIMPAICGGINLAIAVISLVAVSSGKKGLLSETVFILKSISAISLIGLAVSCTWAYLSSK